MSSRKIDGVRFCVNSNDHPPRHVHAQIGDSRIIIDLKESGGVDLADRKDRVTPNAKKSEVRKALKLAAANFKVLTELWEKTHGRLKSANDR
jgi:hypothetical protein